MIATQMQRPDEAARIASDVLKADRGNILAANILARALLAQNRADEAVEPLQRAAKRSGDAETETLLAVVLIAADRADDAIAQLQATITKRPPFAPAFLELAGLYSKLGRFDEGVVLLDGAIALMPDLIDLRMGLGYLHVKRNDRKAARALFIQALTEAPGRHDILCALAQVLALDGDYAGSADLYRRALAIRPDDGLSRINLGKCLFELVEHDAGESALRHAARSAPQTIGKAIIALAAAPRGRFFLRPSDAAKFFQR